MIESGQKKKMKKGKRRMKNKKIQLPVKSTGSIQLSSVGPHCSKSLGTIFAYRGAQLLHYFLFAFSRMELAVTK